MPSKIEYIIADYDILAELRGLLGVVDIHVQRMVIHRQQTKHVVVEFGDRLARPVLVGRTNLELFVTTSKLHDGSLSEWSNHRTLSTPDAPRSASVIT